MSLNWHNYHDPAKHTTSFTEKHLEDVKCAIIIADNNLNNFCSFLVSLSAGGWLYKKVRFLWKVSIFLV